MPTAGTSGLEACRGITSACSLPAINTAPSAGGPAANEGAEPKKSDTDAAAPCCRTAPNSGDCRITAATR
eukprot:2094911-Rhodomonas_salina.1